MQQALWDGVPVTWGEDPELWGWQPTSPLVVSVPPGGWRRVAGDHGVGSTLSLRLSDAEGPVTVGPVDIRTALGVWEMVHAGGGVWEWTPGPDDLTAGRWLVDVRWQGLTLPVRRPVRLRVRARVEVVL